MRALVTGGAGFIGSHLADALLAGGNEVYAVDDLSTGSITNIDSLKHDPSFHYSNGSVTDLELMEDLVDRCDVIFHLAAVVGVRRVLEDPVRTIETNINGTSAILGLAKEKGKKLVLTSTSEVYGNSPQIPFQEETYLEVHPAMKSRWSYAWSKLMDETLSLAYWNQYGLPVVILRLFNTVGPRQTGRYGMVIPRLVGQALAGEPLTVYGDGQQSRCFAFVGDVVRGMIQLAECPEAVGQIVNLGNDQEVTIEDLAQMVRDIAGSPSPITYIPFEQVLGKDFEETRRRQPDLSKVRRLIGYRPTKDLPDIIRSVIDYQQAGH